MIRTSERLKEGASLYYQQFITKVEESKRTCPYVNYPNKVERLYFQRVSEISSSKVEVVFLQRTYYKKVEGYRQVNYYKYKILSKTLYKEKYVSKKLDLTPASLNNLKNHSDSDIARNALGIISGIQQVDCYPSWAQSEFLDLIHKITIARIDDEATSKRNISDTNIKNEEIRKKANKKLIEAVLKSEKTIKEDIIKTIRKALRAGFAEHKVLKAILTLGICNLYRKHKRLKIKAEKLQRKLDNTISRKHSLITTSHEIEDQLVSLKNSRAELEADIAYQIKVEEHQYALDNSNISQPFFESFIDTKVKKDSPQKIEPTYEYNIEEFHINQEDLMGFVSLANENIVKLKGLDIIGVYAVRNNEIGSTYIGLSLDVEKSVSEMFVNFVPSHPLMLKEYKESKLEDKTNLFVIKIKMVNTKDQLINEYIEFDKAFNGKYVHY